MFLARNLQRIHPWKKPRPQQLQLTHAAVGGGARRSVVSFTGTGFHGQTALVSGATGDIGRAVCMNLAGNGARIVAISRDQDKAHEFLKTLPGQPKTHLSVECDFTKGPEEIEAIFQNLKSYNCKPNLLINVAGMISDNLLVLQSPKTINELIQVNLVAPMLLSRVFVKQFMRGKLGQDLMSEDELELFGPARRGRIVHVGSVSAAVGNPGQVAYGAAKAGLEGMVRNLAIELSAHPLPITVNCIVPGLVESRMARSIPKELQEKWEERIPLKRLGTPDEVASLVAFLCSDNADYVTGQSIGINGGLHM